MPFNPSEKLQVILDMMREFLDKEIIPLEKDLESKGFKAIVPDLEKKREMVRKMELWAPLHSKDMGGMGLPLMDVAMIFEILGRSPLGLYVFGCQAPDAGNIEIIHKFGTEEQKEQYCRPTVEGKIRSCFAMTEVDVCGSNPTWILTTAVKDGDDYVINGQKIWTSRAEHSDLMLLLARTKPLNQVSKKTDGLSVFLLDMRKAKGNGLTIRPIRTMMNHATTEVFFDNLRIPASNLVGEENKGFKYILSGMNAERILIAAECIGDAKWFTKKSTNYANDRNIFGRAIGQNQGVQFPIAKAYAHMKAAELMVYHAAKLYEAGKPIGEEANTAKLLAADASWEAAEACVQTHGGFGFAEEYDVERKFREARLYQVAPISTNLILSYIAEHVLGMPRSY